MKHAVIALLWWLSLPIVVEFGILIYPALADAADDILALAEPDDIKCHATVGGFTVLYTYNSKNPPKDIPEGLMCYVRDYEAETAYFKAEDEWFYDLWKTSPKP